MNDPNSTTERSTTSGADKYSWGSTQTYVTVGVVAAAVSATVAYLVWSRYHRQHQESVQELLDDAHNKVRSIEQRLGDLRGSLAVPVPSPSYASSYAAYGGDMGA